MNPYWPVAGIRLRLGDTVLRPITEDDLGRLAVSHPADAETDPRLPAFSDDPLIRAGTAVHQSYWSSVGSWRPESWRLGFVVHVDGVPVGVQEIEANNFAVLRTVETASWLATDWRGRGIGKAMRLAVLALAFDGLGANVAETEAWHDNAASLGVSRSLGYVDNGIGQHARGDHAEDMPRMRLTRAVWTARHTGHGVVIENVTPCLHFFGAEPVRAS